MRADWLWLFNAIKEIDFNFEDFMKECFLVCRESKGGISYKDIKAMSIDDYFLTVKYAAYLQNPKENIDG